MQHRKLDRLMTPVERIARVAAAGLTSATSSATKPSGAKSYDNADGTRTIIGNVANGESNPSYTMATHVGDTTAPGTPTGVTASSKSGVVVVEWDGTLTGGIPDDFYAVRVYLDGSELGILTGAGSVSSASLEGGTTHSVTATAEDDACLPDGTPAHNVSAPTAAISVTVSEGVEGVAAIAQEALDVAEATGQHFWSDTDGIHVTEVTEEEWNDSTGTSYHSGQNVLINALGQLFRKGVDNLMALVAGDTYTESFTMPLHNMPYEWYPTFTLQHAPSRIISAQVGSTDVTDGCLFVDGSTLAWTGKVSLGPGEPGLWGQTLTVTYAISPSLSLWDGLGNVVASLSARVTSLASGMTGSEPGAGEVSFFEGISRLRAEHRPWYDPTGAFTSQNDEIALLIDTEDQRAGKSGSATSGVIARTRFEDSETLSEVTLDIQAFAPDGSNIPTYEEPFFGIRAIATDNQGGETQVVMAAHEMLAISSASGGANVTMPMNDFIHEFTTVISNVTLSNITFSTAPVLYLRRRGTTVSAIMNSVVNASSAGTRISVGTIPAGYRPPQAVLQSGVCVSNNNFNGNYQWRIDTSGAITYLTSVTGAREAPMVLTWQTTNAWPS